MKKFKRVFVPHPNLRFDEAPLHRLADEVIYICNSPMFDDFIGVEYVKSFEVKIKKTLIDFDPDTDVIADFGDAIIFALSIFYLCTNLDSFKIARFSRKNGEYLVREVSDKFFEMEI